MKSRLARLPRLFAAVLARLPSPLERRCVLCGHRVGRFLPYPGGSAKLPPLIRELGVVGSNLDCFECPRCGAHDRERHLFLYLQATGMLETMQDKQILHFAPEKRLGSRIAACQPARHLRCDLYPQTPDVVRVDMLAMQFENASFDILIANHVMEHVCDDVQALREIHRVLKPGGYAILQTPYSPVLLQTWEDAGIASETMRLQAYGQEDHVRLYGRDIFQRFASAGFSVQVKRHEELLGHIEPAKAGVNPSEPFFLFRREA